MDIAGPGFINFILSKGRFTKVIEEVLSKRENFGQQPSMVLRSI